jgi:LemA protein
VAAAGPLFARRQAARNAPAKESLVKGSPMLFVLCFGLLATLPAVLILLLVHNGLARSDERVNERWAQVDAVLQRRLDLIPQLVETVKGYAAHEQETLMGVVQAREHALRVLRGAEGGASKEASGADAELAGSLSRMLALAEQYPDLKANTSFSTLQDQLEGSENRISLERQRYNDSVRDYNGRLRTFPSNVVGSLMGLQAREYFEAKRAADEPVAFHF